MVSVLFWVLSDWLDRPGRALFLIGIIAVPKLCDAAASLWQYFRTTEAMSGNQPRKDDRGSLAAVGIGILAGWGYFVS